ncbi:hypothetical protein [Alcanivorax sp. 1008]|uniref:hypothetical protein n=1 Tax=Alcanivorax sp. 1008 TaxID=2816853 RepID=UPI001DBD627E|nr:hypothetical protein [Alcanivorax sp. 1008]MCC1496135.1 hypothetical protein [Alcanivorax sp. 1008]
MDLSALVPELEKRLGLDSGFFDKLIEGESDWALIIKTHALIEAAVSDLLATSLDRKDLNAIFSSLELSNKRTGKMAFVSALGLLDEDCRRFISALSELRNRLVHNVKNVHFDFHEYVKQLDAQQFRQFVKNFNTLSYEVDEGLLNLFRHDPIQGVWYGAMSVLGRIYLRLEECS